MSEARLKTLQIRVETLPAVYSALVKALGETELSGAVLNEIISGHVSAACVLCDIQVKGDDLSAVALAPQSGNLAEARLARLKQGYCCRRSCDSYYYKLVFAPHPSVHWEKIIEKLADAKSQIGDDKADEGVDRKVPARRALVIKVAAGVGLVLVLLLCKHLMSGGSLPGFQRAPKYTVDPSSLPTTPRR